MALVRAHVLICTGTGCTSSGSQKVIEKFHEELAAKGLADEVRIVPTGCHGFCECGPLVIIYPEGTFYTRVQPGDVSEIVEVHLLKGRTVERLLYKEPLTAAEVPNYAPVLRPSRLTNTPPRKKRAAASV